MADQFLNKTGLTRLWTKVKSYMGATYFKLTGGTLTGNVVIQPTGTPNLSLSAPEKENVGRSKTTLYKNASSTVDYGTMLIDYVWGNGSSENQRTTLRLLSSANSVADRIALLDYAAGGSYTLYRLYGEHNKPSTSDITGLATALAGKAPSTHSHGADDITSGTLNTARLPIVPISKGGTGAADALAAITALGGLSAASNGTPLANGDDIDALTTPGTYLSADSTVSASLQGTPPYTTGGFKLYVIRGYQNGVTIQLAQGASVTVYCRIKTSATGAWGSWQTYALGGHTHGSIRTDGSIAQDTDPEVSDRLVITDASDGNIIKRGNIRLDGTTTNKALTPKGTWETFLQTHQDISGKADVGHTHAYLPLSGGALTGNLSIQPSGTTPSVILRAPEKEGVGQSRSVLYKNASASTDNGTIIVDYVWGDATSSNQRTALQLRSAATALKDRLTLRDYAAGGDSIAYRIFGEHNPPTIADVSYLQSTLNNKAAANHTHDAEDIDSGTLDAARLPAATASTQGAVKLGASGGAAAYSHTHTVANVTGLQSALDGKAASAHSHDAGDIESGTIAAARLPAATSTTQGAVKLGTSGGAAAYSHTHSYLPLAGGTLTGSLTMDPTGNSVPILTLVTADGTAGPGRVTLHKNANATADYGTQLTDYAWGDGGSTSNKNVRIILRAATNALDSMLTMSVNQGTGGSSTVYRMYGEHYKPMLDDHVTMTGTEDLNTITAVGWYRCRTNNTSRTIKHTPGFNTTTLVNTAMVAFNLTVGRCAGDYAYQELLEFNTGKRWYRYTANPTADSPSWGAWNEH